MIELHLPWLELSIGVPLVGAAYIGLLKNRTKAYRHSIVICLITLACTLGGWLDFGQLHAFEAHDYHSFIQQLLGREFLIIDELSAPLLPLAALLCAMTVMSTLRTKLSRFSLSWTLFSEAILIATFSCRHPWALIGLMALSALPPWIEIRSRGFSTRVYSLHMGLFIGLLACGWWLTGLASNSSTPNSILALTGGAMLLLAALLRGGIVPVHVWITDLFEKATFGTALLYVTPMTGAYAVMRLVFPLAPTWVLQGIALVSLITAVYAAAMALVETDARRFFCYLFLSHSSLVLVGLELVTPIGLTGALCVWISVSLSLAGFGLTLRALEARLGRLTLDRFHGLYDRMPTMAGFFLLTGLASISFPGTIGFIGSELLVEGAVHVYPLIGLAVVAAAALNGIAMLLAYLRIFTGVRPRSSISLTTRPVEWLAIVTLAFLLIGGGLYPSPGVTSRHHAATELLLRRKETSGGETTGEAVSALDLYGDPPSAEVAREALTVPP